MIFASIYLVVVIGLAVWGFAIGRIGAAIGWMLAAGIIGFGLGRVLTGERGR